MRIAAEMVGRFPATALSFCNLRIAFRSAAVKLTVVEISPFISHIFYARDALRDTPYAENCRHKGIHRSFRRERRPPVYSLPLSPVTLFKPLGE
jgi:hypothetical protein